MTSPVFSVIIPARNAASFIAEALESVLNQSFSDYEVIVINDNSNDETITIVQRFIRRFPQGVLRLFNASQGHLPGPGAVRNVGVRAANGSILAFLDADDLWENDHLEHAVRAFTEHPEAVAYYSRSLQFDQETGRSLDDMGDGPQGGGLFDAFPELILKDIIPNASGCVRTDVALKINGFEERLETAQDWWFWICVSKQGQFFFSDRIEMRYRCHMGSHTGGGAGEKPMFSYPRLACLAAHSGILNSIESKPLYNYLIDDTSRRLQHIIRTGRVDVMKKVMRTFRSCSKDEKIVWLTVFGDSFRRLFVRILLSVAVLLRLLPAERQFK